MIRNLPVLILHTKAGRTSNHHAHKPLEDERIKSSSTPHLPDKIMKNSINILFIIINKQGRRT
jgi:hypothetical protein